MLPQGKPKHDEYFGDTEVYLRGRSKRRCRSRAPRARAARCNLKVTYQGCAEGGLCYNPITQERRRSSCRRRTSRRRCRRERASPQRSSDAARRRWSPSRTSSPTRPQTATCSTCSLTFFVAGLAAVAHAVRAADDSDPLRHHRRPGRARRRAARGFSLAFTYVQGMALTYAAAGAVFVLAFKQAPQAFFQQPWIIIAVRAAVRRARVRDVRRLHAADAERAADAARPTSATSRSRAPTSARSSWARCRRSIVTACVAPAIIARAVGDQPDAAGRCAAPRALYATGLGMGVPLLIVGASAGALLPKVGPWMDTVKQLFGVLFLGVAIYLARPAAAGRADDAAVVGARDLSRLLDLLAEGTRRRAGAGAVARRRAARGRLRHPAADRRGVGQQRSAAAAGSI